MSYIGQEIVRIILIGLSRQRFLNWVECSHEKNHKHISYNSDTTNALAILISPGDDWDDPLVRLLDCDCEFIVYPDEIHELTPLEQLALQL